MPEENKTTLLVVEDEVLIRTGLMDELTDEGFRVITAEDGKLGLELALREKPNLILLDILMPVMDGLAMMKKVREANEWGKNVPIILLTNLSPNEDKIIAAVSADEPAYYLVKSDWTLKGIVEKIKERLARK